MSWDPAQYLKFAGHRRRPALDLLGRIPAESPRIVVDLGCGAGNVTGALRERWPDAQVVGVDGSPAMLRSAAEVVSDVTWVEADLADWRPDDPVDVLFSNAALHWLPDHERLFPRLFAAVAPGGWFAVQMPRNFAAPSHTAIAEAARAGPWRSVLEPLLGPAPVSEPASYYRLLARLAAEIDIWETEYLQILEGDNPVAEWTKGTWLRPFLDALSGDHRAAFEAAYRDRVRAAYPPGPDGKIALPFRRLFIVARRGY